MSIGIKGQSDLISSATCQPTVRHVSANWSARVSQLVDSVAANVLQYVISSAADPNTLYQVTAVYNRGESAAASCQGIATGISSVKAPEGIKLIAGVLSSCKPVRVYTASGTLVFKGVANGIQLPHGLYIIAADNKAYKVTIR